MKNSPALTSIRSTMIFLLVLMATLIGLSSVFEPATARLRAAAPVGTINSNYALLSEVFVSIAVFISLLIMRRIDKTPLAERNFGKRPRYGEVALGLSAGLSTLAFVLLIQLALGVLRITPSAEAAPLQIHDCVIWAQCFLITGICEEAVFRGYLLGTLQKGTWVLAGYRNQQRAVCGCPSSKLRRKSLWNLRVCALLRTFRADGQTDRHDLVCRGIPRGLGLVPDLFVWNLRQRYPRQWTSSQLDSKRA
jgi:membrane protease YdiL (CAAX protease family)